MTQDDATALDDLSEEDLALVEANGIRLVVDRASGGRLLRAGLPGLSPQERAVRDRLLAAMTERCSRFPGQRIRALSVGEVTTMFGALSDGVGPPTPRRLRAWALVVDGVHWRGSAPIGRTSQPFVTAMVSLHDATTGDLVLATNLSHPDAVSSGAVAYGPDDPPPTRKPGT